jgi:hypothetical protein
MPHAISLLSCQRARQHAAAHAQPKDKQLRLIIFPHPIGQVEFS